MSAPFSRGLSFTSMCLTRFCLAESWIAKCGSKLIYETLPEKEAMYVLSITSILGRLPVVWARDTGTIQFSYRDGYRNGAHRYNQDLAKADTPAPGLRTVVPCTVVSSWALRWSRDE